MVRWFVFLLSLLGMFDVENIIQSALDIVPNKVINSCPDCDPTQCSNANTWNCNQNTAATCSCSRPDPNTYSNCNSLTFYR